MQKTVDSGTWPPSSRITGSPLRAPERPVEHAEQAVPRPGLPQQRLDALALPDPRARVRCV
jgi:hypothetical protein